MPCGCVPCTKPSPPCGDNVPSHKRSVWGGDTPSTCHSLRVRYRCGVPHQSSNVETQLVRTYGNCELATGHCSRGIQRRPERFQPENVCRPSSVDTKSTTLKRAERPVMMDW